MTIDEAIKIYEMGAKRTWNGRLTIYAEQCQQMAEWLKDYKRLLEQEPFINKPCVSEKVCEHDKQMVLDKIRSEIDSHCSDNRDRNDGLYIAMKIIDKYTAESEDKE